MRYAEDAGFSRYSIKIPCHSFVPYYSYYNQTASFGRLDNDTKYQWANRNYSSIEYVMIHCNTYFTFPFPIFENNYIIGLIQLLKL